MKILSYIVGIIGMLISGYSAFFVGMPTDGYTIFGLSIVVFANILHRESMSKES